jgi:diadenosine tetraphosphate (Ap4A) HIT family hydrolase
MTSCSYCLIAQGVEQAAVVYEDDDVIAIAAHEPLHPGHCSVFPRAHTASLTDLDARVATHLWLIALTVERGIAAAGMRDQGITMVLDDGLRHSTVDEHLALHVVPRRPEDSWSVIEAPRMNTETRLLDRVARLVREGLT